MEFHAGGMFWAISLLFPVSALSLPAERQLDLSIRALMLFSASVAKSLLLIRRVSQHQYGTGPAMAFKTCPSD